MRPFFKTWLTICLLLPLAAHATTREQRLPAPKSEEVAPKNPHVGKTDKAATQKVAKNEKQVKTAKNDNHAAKTTAKSSASASKKHAAPAEARNTKHIAPKVAHVGKASVKENAKANKPEATPEVEIAEAEMAPVSSHGKRGKHATVAMTSAQRTAAQMSNKQSSEVLSRAVNALGTPYVYGGSNPKKGFDCSGLVKYAFKDVHAVDLPRTSNAMAQGHGQKVDRKDLKPGDLLFFNIEGRQVNHVAIYLGNDRFIHAPRTGKSVSIDTLDKPYWDEHYVVAKRVLPKQKQQPVLRLSQR
jgi:chitinase